MQKAKSKDAKEFSNELDGFLEAEGVARNQLLNNKHILNQALKSGLTAAVISIVLQTAPAIVSLIGDLIKHGHIDISHVKQTGTAILTGGAEGFLTGGISAAITTAYLKEFSDVVNVVSTGFMPHFIGAVTVIAVRAVKCSFGVATGKISGSQLSNTILQDVTITMFSLGFGAATQALIPLPVFGYMLGSFVGSIVGGFVYTGSKKLCLSFCVDKGFAFFGLVKHDYTLPKEILEELGLEIFEYERFEYNTFQFDAFDLEQFDFETFEFEAIDIRVIRRGVIGVNTVGFLT